ncbi:protein of unknown function (plasmid) [Azospirillum baldaniorum]|uniref:Uncharacterized protein n=1 Tax=Azospirillum baldaniorum TaxID=1064539 RepID=A0A9P1NRP0_9PROT|nr:protein of unknown function [Azospirillum baldaniorum]
MSCRATAGRSVRSGSKAETADRERGIDWQLLDIL